VPGRQPDQSIHAILNGTSNFILTRMEEQETSYAAAVAEAQQRGYAEANPAMDVNGSDAGQKLAILSHLPSAPG
jgi:homoserine dehydrogenase